MWIRTASKDDINAIHDLLIETWHTVFDELIGRDKVNLQIEQHYTLDLLKKYLSRPNSECVVADDGETLHGAAYAAQGAIKGDSEIAVIFYLCVKPESQGMGVGRRLLIELEEAFPSARKIRISVNKNDVRAHEFFVGQDYKKLGNNADNTTPEDIVFEKTLF